MENLKIRGRLPDGLKREEVRAWVHACRCILEFHKKSLDHYYKTETGEEDDGNTITLLFQDRPDVEGEEVGGWALRETRTMAVSNQAGRGFALRTILHETIHLYCTWVGGQEMPTSTLTHRLFGEVEKVFKVLIENLYRRAGWLAHGQLSYSRTVENDSYNPQEEELCKKK